jgi:hypothetical protein
MWFAVETGLSRQAATGFLTNYAVIARAKVIHDFKDRTVAHPGSHESI